MAFHGEQGGEAMHREFNKLMARAAHIHPAVKRIESVLKNHMITNSPALK